MLIMLRYLFYSLYGGQSETLDAEDFDVQVIEIADLGETPGDEFAVAFPKHIRCAAHRLNLVARSFETKLDKKYGTHGIVHSW